MDFPALVAKFRTAPSAEATSADLRAALDDARRQRDEASAAIATLNRGFGDVLLTADPEAEARHTGEVKGATDQLRRATALMGALELRIPVAEAREAEEALQAEIAATERDAAAAAKDVPNYVKAARQVFQKAEAINAAAKRVRALNDRLRALGREELAVTPPLTRAWPSSRRRDLDSVAIPGPHADTARDAASFERALLWEPPPPPRRQPAPPPEPYSVPVMTISRTPL